MRILLVLLAVACSLLPGTPARGTRPAVAKTSARTSPKTGVEIDRVLVPAGPAVLGSNNGALDERPQRTKHIPRFRIDRTEVTRRQYAKCIGAGRCRVVADLGGGGREDGEAIDRPDEPITGVSWTEADSFCRFARGRLPTEAEWEKAARGADGRDYPWGNDLACDKANWGSFAGEGPCKGAPGRAVAAGQYPDAASPYGALDMAGNVWEWVQDRYPEHPERRIVKGGSCCSYFVEPRAANRNAWDADYRDSDLGFRCAAR